MEISSSLFTPASLTSSSEGSVTHRPSSTKQHHAPTKRNRSQLSCVHCRHAKLKCDRQEPCSQCSKRGRQCMFPAAKSAKKPAMSMKKRLEHLESLVKDVMTGQSPEQINSISTSVSDVSAGSEIAASHHGSYTAYTENVNGAPSQNLLDDVTGVESGLLDSSGSVIRGPRETAYVGATHWAAILDNIEEVKSYFTTEEVYDERPDETPKPDTSLIFSFHSMTKEGILAALPNRPVVDCLVSRYFNSDSPSLHLIHKPTFQSEYGKFWANPSRTPLSWIALLYGLMSLATFTSLTAVEECPDQRGSHMEMIRMYRGCCAQSLVVSDYTKPNLYTIEALLIYGEGDFVITKTAQVNGYILTGVMVRLALRMGLHRDPSKVGGNISVFQAELRRRSWHLVVQIDQLVSFHIGLPAMASTIESDTEYPRNLRDEDFNTDTVELPLGRPDTEMTPMSYTLAKSRLCKVFGIIAVQANKLSLPPYEEVMRTDTLLNEAYAKVPSFLRLVRLELAVTDSADLIMKRFSLALMFHRSRCVLHRKYLLREKDSPIFAYSKREGLDASMKLLHIQFSVDRAVQPDGAFSKTVWFMSSLSIHDFLLAATIVYLNLIKDIGVTQITLDSDQAGMHQALEKSYAVWMHSKDTLEDARKASDILGLMLAKIKLTLDQNNGVKNKDFTPVSDNTIPSGDPRMSRLSLNDFNSNEYFNPNPLISPDWQTATEINTQSLEMTMLEAQNDSLSPFPFDSFGNMLDVPVDFDWDLFDSHMRPVVPVVDQSWPDISLDSIGFDDNDIYYNL